MAIRGSLEAPGRSHERPGDHTANADAASNEVKCDFAHPIQLRNRNHVFVSGDLEHAVRRRVDDRLSGPHMFGTEPVDDLGARCHDVAEDATANSGFKFGDDRCRETFRERRERPIQHDAHHLPVARHRVLPRRRFRHATVGAFGRPRIAAAETGDATESKGP